MTHKKRVSHKGKEYDVEAFELPSGKWGAVIFPVDLLKCYPVTEPDATGKQGPYVEFDTPDEALGGGKSVIEQDNLREPDPSDAGATP